MPFVLDNSIAMRWLFGDGSPSDKDYAGRVLDATEAAEAVVPAIWCLEVVNVIARAEQKYGLSEDRSAKFIQLLFRLGIQVDMHAGLQPLHLVLPIARRYKLTAYDAAYLELAMRTAHPLATLDLELRKAAQQAGVEGFMP